MMFFLSHVIAMSSTCYNPLLYGWLNSAFRYFVADFSAVFF